MTSTDALHIQHLTSADADDAALVARLTALINQVYRDSEQGLWTQDTDRTTTEEVTGLIRAAEIAVARRDGEIVGCVRVQSLDAETGEFGMLAADPEFRGIGVGRELVRYAEQLVRSRGRRSMQLELLVPQGWVHPSKDFLAGWYGRLGYVVTGKGSIEEAHPNLAPLLATPCDFLIWHKDLSGG